MSILPVSIAIIYPKLLTQVLVFPHNISLSIVQSGRIRFDLFSQLDTSRRHTTMWTPKILRPLDYLAISTLPSTASLSKINSRSQFFTGQYQLSLCRSYDVCHVESAIVRLVFPTVKRIDAPYLSRLLFPIRTMNYRNRGASLILSIYWP